MKDYEALSRAHFNRQAARYDENESVYFSGPAKRSCADVLRLLENVEYRSLLDVGCGTGWLLAQLAARCPAEYRGLDLAENMLNRARAKQIPGARFVLGTADVLPWPDGRFDVVCCIQSFHHYPYPDKAMAEALRVLRPGGLYVLSDTGVGGPAAWLDNHVFFPLMRSGDCHTENRRGVARRMERAGFRNVEHWQVKGFIYTVTGRKP